MITVRLYGRLANQMFQIAAAIALALRNNVDYFIPQITINPTTWANHFKFPIKKMEIVSTYTEPSAAWQEIPYSAGLQLDGYFQSEKYFIDYKEEVIRAMEKALNITPPEPMPDTVGIHVRRGDYLLYGTDFPVVSAGYISAAIDYFKNLGYKKFLFFSDDLRWCKVNFPGHQYSEQPNRFPYKPKIDLWKMSACAHQIISNSTFGVWAAIINKNPEKIVVCPPRDKWGNVYFAHNIPDDWIQLNTNKVAA